jgi:hypothetical protein
MTLGLTERGNSRPNIMLRVTLLGEIVMAGSDLIHYILELD